MTDAERIIAAWRDSGCPVDVIISTDGPATAHRIRGWIFDFEGAACVRASDACFVLLPKSIFSDAKRVEATTSAKGTLIEIDAGACRIFISDEFTSQDVGNA